MLATSLETEFGRRLLTEREAGRLSDGELVYRLQEEAYWHARIAEWEILGVKKIRRDAAGRLTDEFLTIDDFRAEILSDLGL